MSNKKFSRPSLALFTAIALSGGAFFAPSFASAADVTIDSTHPPQRNVPNPDDPSTPNSAASVGTGSEDASGNSLTVDRYQEDTLSVFGGVARGTGNADGNTVRIKGATTEIASVYGGAAWGTGHARENRVHFDAGTMSFAEWLVGGYVRRSGKARGNAVTIESAVHDVVGGEGSGEASGNTVDIRANAAAVTGGKSMGAASNNRVTLGNITATSVVGGDAVTAAEGNIVSLDGTTVTNDVVGGRGAAANGNTIHLRNTVVNGIVTGGAASGGVGNTLAVYYRAGTSSIHDFKGIENLRLDVEDAPTDGTAHTLLKLTNVSGGSKNLTNMTLDFRRSGAARKLQAGDSFTLLENASGKITVGEGVTMKGTDGIAHDCLFAIAPDKAHPEKLRATVTKTGVGETAKSPVETRAGLANFVNQGADYLVGSGFTAAELSAENASADDAAESRASAKDTQRRTVCGSKLPHAQAAPRATTACTARMPDMTV